MSLEREFSVGQTTLFPAMYIGALHTSNCVLPAVKIHFLHYCGVSQAVKVSKNIAHTENLLHPHLPLTHDYLFLPTNHHVIREMTLGKGNIVHI